MNANYQIRELEKELIRDVVSLVRDAFNPGHLLLSVYRATGVEKYIDSSLENPLSTSEYFVAVEKKSSGKDILAGFCECKTLNDCRVSLNMIATAPAFKAQGVGGILLDFCIEHYRQAGKKRIQLDVAQSNEVAYQWYKKKGFRKDGEKHVYKLFNMREDCRAVGIYNYSQYTLLSTVYGFATIDIMEEENILRLGVIGNDLFIKDNIRQTLASKAYTIQRKLGLSDIYFVTEEHYKGEALLIDTVTRMQLDI